MGTRTAKEKTAELEQGSGRLEKQIETRSIARLLSISGLLLAATACSPSQAVPAAACTFDNHDCDYHSAIAPGTALTYIVSWQATCSSPVTLPDVSSNLGCDPQPFTARVICEGGSCESDPPAAAKGGVSLSGAQRITVRPSTTGDITLKVQLEHDDTHEVFTSEPTAIRVRQPDRLVIDAACRNSTFVWHPCEANEKFLGLLEFSMWMYGKSGDDVVFVSPIATQFKGAFPNNFEMSGGAVHPEPALGRDADIWSGSMVADQTMTVSTSAGPLTGSLSIHAEYVPPLAAPFNILSVSNIGNDEVLSWESSAGAESYSADISKLENGDCSTLGVIQMGGLTGTSVSLKNLSVPHGDVCVSMKAIDINQNARTATNAPLKTVLP